MRRINGAVLLALIILSSACLTSGLELTASTGGSGGSSSTHMVYGATIDDYADQHIGLSPIDGTLSNAYSGTGSLPHSESGTQDSKGNRAIVSRSVEGEADYTTWSYGWGTSNRNGARAWIDNMNVQNAYEVTGGSKAYNLRGDSAVTEMSVFSPEMTVSISNYYTSAKATLTDATAKTESFSATGAEEIRLKATASNGEKDVAYSYADLWDGVSSGYSSNSLDAAIELANSAEASSDSATAKQSVQSASGGKIILGCDGNNAKQVVAGASGEIHNGKLYSSASSTEAYTDWAKSTSSSVKVKQKKAEFATGEWVRFGAGAFNKDGNSLQFQIAAGNGILGKGYLEGYNNYITASSSTLSGKQHAYGVEGDWYTQDLGVSYSTRNSAGSFGSGQGAIWDYKGTSFASKTEKKSSASVDMASGNIKFGTNAYDDFNVPNKMMTSVGIDLKDGNLKGYSNSAKTFRKIEGKQEFESASGGLINTNSRAASTDGMAITSTQVSDGEVTKYSDNAEIMPGSKDELAETSLNISSTKGSAVKIEVYASNDNSADFNSPAKQYATSSIIGANPDLKYQGIAKTKTDLSGLVHCNSTASFTANKPSALFIKARAVNDIKGLEYLESIWGKDYYYSTVGGIADFEVEDVKLDSQASGSINAESIYRTTTSDGQSLIGNVIINHELPEQIKKAIILEPMNYAFTQKGGATDDGTTIVPTLLSNGYAVLRYTDSAASRDKFSSLGDYNIVLIRSHMAADMIALSTAQMDQLYAGGDYYMQRNTLETSYREPPDNSMVILAGCNSIEPGYRMPIVDAFREADLILGFTNKVAVKWNADSVIEFFRQMGNGLNAFEALEYVNEWDQLPHMPKGFRYDWWKNSGIPPYSVELVDPIKLADEVNQEDPNEETNMQIAARNFVL